MSATDWKQEMLWLTVIYRMLECQEKIPLDVKGSAFEFIEKELDQMHAKGLIEISSDNTRWIPTEKGEELRTKMIAMFDQMLKFEIFGDVNLAYELGEDVSEDGMHVFDHVYDPRFQPPETDAEKEQVGTEDLRIAMVTYLADQMAKDDDAKEALQGGTGVDPHRIVFLQRVADGQLKSDGVWFDLKLGTPFKDIEEIVESAYKYTDVSDDPDEVDAVMQAIYTAGMLEQRKRDGFECKKCGIPLAIFEMNAKEDGEELKACPNPDCKTPFEPPPPPPNAETWECPNCETEVVKGQNYCRACGARIDFSLPEGTIEVTQEPAYMETYVDDYGYGGYDHYYGYGYGYDAWGGYYGYTPYGYYDPWDPFVNAVAFGVVCAVIF